jgi:hypothetical protein
MSSHVDAFHEENKLRYMEQQLAGGNMHTFYLHHT